MKTIAETDILQIVSGADRYNRADIMAHRTFMFDDRADFAREMIRTWGMVAGKPATEGEAATTTNIALLTPADVVERACETAYLAFKAFEARGWAVKLPNFEDLGKDKE